MDITIGHTPDADDAFMFYGMLSGKVTSPHFNVKHIVEDIETLNKRALTHELDVTAVSAHACAYLKEYTILRSGGSFGKGYGPIVVAKQELDFGKIARLQDCNSGKTYFSFSFIRTNDWQV